jgi:carboxyl-terminal processing protease
MRSRALLAIATALVLSCGGVSSPTSPGGGASGRSTGSSSGTTDCTTVGQVGFVRDVLQSWYYWDDRLPSPDLAGFSSPEAYLDVVRYRAVDSTFSYITSKAASDGFYSGSQFVGFGLSYEASSPTELRLVQAFPGSPAASAGLDRGDTLLAIGGREAADLLASGDIGTIFGPDQVGYELDFAWRSRQGGERTARLAKALVTIPTVSPTAVIDSGGRRVGYVHLRNFVEPSVAALDTAFAQLREAGADELVLDLRYNGGGLVSVAQHLAGLVGGTSTAGQVFVQFTHNDKQSSRNTAYRFESLPQALGVRRLVVITTHATASASEAIVNGLRPYMDVRTVGDTTYGKPVGQYGFDFCDKVLYPVAFLVTNAYGQADYFGGISADCAAPDDLEHPLASPEEASLSVALGVLRTGHCSGPAAVAAAVGRRRRAGLVLPPRGGWRLMLNAW